MIKLTGSTGFPDVAIVPYTPSRPTVAMPEVMLIASAVYGPSTVGIKLAEGILAISTLL